jgi:hypothetical protein
MAVRLSFAKMIGRYLGAALAYEVKKFGVVEMVVVTIENEGRPFMAITSMA